MATDGAREETRRGYDAEQLRKCVTDSYPSVLDRYYRKFYKINLKGREGDDYCVLLHSNRICLITLAPSHPILKEKKTVVKVDFQINKRTNRLQNPLSGKRKRGAQQLVEDAALCIVKCDDGSTYQPCGCIKGSLIEANENLITNPHLLSTKPDTDGYIAIVLTKLQDHKQEIAKLLTPEQYHEKLQEREKKQCLMTSNRSQRMEVMETIGRNGTDVKDGDTISKDMNVYKKEADCDGLTKSNQNSLNIISAKLITAGAAADDDKNVKIDHLNDDGVRVEICVSKSVNDDNT